MYVAFNNMELLCSIQHYDWGKFGSDHSCLVAKYHFLNTGRDINSDKPYAEFWMGTHKNGPSFQKQSNTLLSSILGHEIPFLFKVLSIKKALSIQAHPDKKLAKELHARDPIHYPDDNHKPEMVIALNDFVAMCGFLSLDVMKKYMNGVTAWGLLARREELNDSQVDPKDYLSRLITRILNMDSLLVKSSLDLIEKELKVIMNNGLDLLSPLLISTFQSLLQDYPNDPGVFFVFLLNTIHLTRGEAIFLSANEPHAYISGDCIEIMASSDNVVRAGLTSKFKDIQTLCSMLTFSLADANSAKVQPQAINQSRSMLYSQPNHMKDFAILTTSFLTNDTGQHQLDDLNSESIIFCTQGNGDLCVKDMNTVHNLSIHAGSVVYISPNSKVFITLDGKETTLFRAFSQRNED